MANLEDQAATLPSKLSFSYDETCQELGCGRTKLHSLISTGQLPARKLGDQSRHPAGRSRRLPEHPATRPRRLIPPSAGISPLVALTPSADAAGAVEKETSP